MTFRLASMRIMVTGGSGYIGAHCVRALIERGDLVLVTDDVVTGSLDRIPGVPVICLDLAATGAADVLETALREHRIDAVIHFAARKQVGESVTRPAWYFQQNIGGLANLLLAMESAGTDRLVFSSSAAVYGDVEGAVDEGHPTRPISPYGATKLAGEELIAAAAAAWPLRAASLRYFNVGGSGSAELGDTEAFNLIPMVMERLEAGLAPRIFGDDYATPDGTCVRDYVHVTDVAEAHLAVLDALDPAPGNTILNIGTGRGTSVREMIDAIQSVAGSNLPAVVEPRRPGDPDAVVADVGRVRAAAGWTARFGLNDIVRSAWESRAASAVRVSGGTESSIG